MQQYLELLRLFLDQGKIKEDRTGTGTLSVFGVQMRYNLKEGFPLLTTKQISLKPIIYELLWFLRGDTNLEYLHQHGVRIWDPWADANGDLGRIYGAQWNDWRTSDGRSINQLEQVVREISINPTSRRLIVTAWNPGETEQMSIPNCCSLFQFYVQDGELSCQLYQRSADLFLGVPFNLACYSLLTMMIAQVTELKPCEFIHTFGDLHIYRNHLEQARLQLSREPRSLPKMQLNANIRKLCDFEYEDFELTDYSPYLAIKAPIAV